MSYREAREQMSQLVDLIGMGLLNQLLIIYCNACLVLTGALNIDGADYFNFIQ
jgi:hypothetical protein